MIWQTILGILTVVAVLAVGVALGVLIWRGVAYLMTRLRYPQHKYDDLTSKERDRVNDLTMVVIVSTFIISFVGYVVGGVFYA